MTSQFEFTKTKSLKNLIIIATSEDILFWRAVLNQHKKILQKKQHYVTYKLRMNESIIQYIATYIYDWHLIIEITDNKESSQYAHKKNPDTTIFPNILFAIFRDQCLYYHTCQFKISDSERQLFLKSTSWYFIIKHRNE